MKRLKKVACLFLFSLIVLICILDNVLRKERRTQSSQTKVKIHDVLFEPSNGSLCMFSQSPRIIGNNRCRYLRDKKLILNNPKMCPILKERMVNKYDSKYSMLKIIKCAEYNLISNNALIFCIVFRNTRKSFILLSLMVVTSED